jgi:hypothetical protein
MRDFRIEHPPFTKIRSHQPDLALEMKTVLELERQFAGIREMSPAEGVAVVEHVVIVSNVQRTEPQIPVLPE